MKERLQTYRKLREVTGWGRLATVAFLWQYGSRFARVSVSASEGVRARNRDL